MALKLVCSNCGQRTDKNANICLHCRGRFEELREHFPPFTFAIALAYAGMILFGGAKQLLTHRVLYEWLLAVFCLIAVGATVLAFVIKSRANENLQRVFRRLAAVCALVAALVVIVFGLIFLFETNVWRFKMKMSWGGDLVILLLLLGAVVLPVCFWRLTRSKLLRGLGMAGFAAALLVGSVLLAWELSTKKQPAQRWDGESTITEIPTNAPGEFAENKSVATFGPVVKQSDATVERSHSSLTEQPPVVVETFPVSGARDVEPGETEIRVRFSKPMAEGSWSWSDAWENSAPEFIGSPYYEADQKTCVVKVKLEPGRTYAFWLNSEKILNFKDTENRPAVPYLLIFQTIK